MQTVDHAVLAMAQCANLGHELCPFCGRELDVCDCDDFDTPFVGGDEREDKAA